MQTTDALYQEEIKFRGELSKEIEVKINLPDTLFIDDTNIYNHQLAIASFVFAMSSVSTIGSAKHWGDDIKCGREDLLMSTYLKFGFENIEFYNYDISLNDPSSKTAFGVASRKINNDDDELYVISVVIRSGGYGCEWADNFNLGPDSLAYHRGFYNCSKSVKAIVDKYINQYDNSKIKLWICGYSRGGAIANILGALYNEDIYGENVMTYTFASPNTVSANNDTSLSLNYDNIFNLINPYDPVAKIPPQTWNFCRFGSDLIFPTPNDDNIKDKSIFKKVKNEFYKITSMNYELFEESPINIFTDMIAKISGNRNNYSNIFEPIAKEVIVATMTKEFKDDKWQKQSFKKYITNKYGEKGREALAKCYSCESYNTINYIGLKIPDQLFYFDVLSRIYGIAEPEKLYLKNINIDSLVEHNIASVNSLTQSVSGHFPEIYLSWLIAWEPVVN